MASPSAEIGITFPETYNRPQEDDGSGEWPLVAPLTVEGDDHNPPASENAIAHAPKGTTRATLTHTGRMVDNFVIEYSGHQIWDKTEELPRDEIVITYQRPYKGARWRTLGQCTKGRFSAYIKMCAGETDGIVASFYTSSHEGSRDMDEVDFEFLGKDKTHVQTNFFVDGKGGHEQWQPLGFDASLDFHLYEIDIRQDRIAWYVDGKKIRVEDTSNNPKIPSKPFYLYAGLWESSGAWAGVSTFKDEPYYVHYKEVKVPLQAVTAPTGNNPASVAAA